MAEILASQLVDMVRDPSTNRDVAIRMVQMAMADARRGIRNKAEKILGNLRNEISNLSLDDEPVGLEPPKALAWKSVNLGDIGVSDLYHLHRGDRRTFRKIGLTSSIEVNPDSLQDPIGHAFSHDPLMTVEVL